MAFTVGSFAYYIFLLFIIVSLGLLEGVLVFSASAHAKKNWREVSELLINGAYFSVIIIIILGSCLVTLPAYIKPFLSKGISFEETTKYLYILSIAFPGYILLTFIRDILSGIGKAHVNSIISITGVPISILLSSALGIGLGTLPSLGIYGVAWSFVIVVYIMLLASLLYTFSVVRKHINFSSINLRPNTQVIISLFRFGLPMSILFTFQIGIFSMTSIFMASLNDRSLLANQILNQTLDMVFLAFIAFGDASTIKITQAVSKRKHQEIVRSIRASFIITLSISSLILFLTVYFSHTLPLLFMGLGQNEISTETLELASQFIIAGGVYQFFRNIQVTFVSVFKSFRDTALPVFICIASYWLLGISLGGFGVLYYHLPGIFLWGMLTLSALFSNILLFWRYNFLLKKLILL